MTTILGIYLLVFTAVAAHQGADYIRFRSLEVSDSDMFESLYSSGQQPEQVDQPLLLPGERVGRGPDWRWGAWLSADARGTVVSATELEGWWWVRFVSPWTTMNNQIAIPSNPQTLSCSLA